VTVGSGAVVRKVATTYGAIIGGLAAATLALAVVAALQVRPGRPLELSGLAALAALGLVVLLLLTLLSLPVTLLLAWALHEPARPAPPPATEPWPVDEPAAPALTLAALLEGQAAPPSAGGWQVRVLRAEERDRMAGEVGPARGSSGARTRWLVLIVALSNQTGGPARLAPADFALVDADGAAYPHGSDVMAYHLAEQEGLFSLAVTVPDGATVTTPLVFTAPSTTARLSLQLSGVACPLPGADADLLDHRESA
jgi:hypothetical protein